jgi:hypothetical protein
MEDYFLFVLSNVKYPGYAFKVYRTGSLAEPSYYLQITCDGQCNVTGAPMSWKSRKWQLSRHMTVSEIVQTAFMATMAANEHETRENFTYKGASVFDPHYDVEKLHALRTSGEAISERAAA